MRILSSSPVLAVHDLERSAAWYAEVLGAEVTEPDPGNWTFCRCGDISFMLGRCPDDVPAAEIGNHSYVAYLRVDDVGACCERAVAADAEFWRRPPIGRGPCGRWDSDHPTGTVQAG